MSDTVTDMVDSIAGVMISTTVARFPAMRDFYVETLGLAPRSQREGFINFELGSVRLTVSVHDLLDGPTGDPARIMVNLATIDIDAAYARMLASGVTVIRPPAREEWGGRICTVADPDGNFLQLMTFPAVTAG